MALARTLSLVLGLASSAALAAALAWSGSPLTWFARPWILCLLYSPPAFFADLALILSLLRSEMLLYEVLYDH